MTFQTNKNDPYNRGRDELNALLRSIWLGMGLALGTPFGGFVYLSK